jgi:RNA polymerase sigma-70 factor (ECF subfamily)
MSHEGDSSEEADLEAMQRLAAGEDLALNGIMERWKSRLISYLFRFTGNHSTAVDLAQECFVRLYQARARFRPTASPRCFSNWIFGIAANLGRNHLRWQGRHPTLPLEEAGDPASPGDPSLSAQSHERSEAVRKAIAALPPDLREALILSEYENLSQAEIATIAGCSVKAVERRVSHAREQLRRALERYL